MIACTFMLSGEGHAMADAEKSRAEAEADVEHIAKGAKLYKSKCSFCYKPHSTETLVGPGLAGILKKSRLPSSNEPATPEMIIQRLRTPYKNMPSFSYLSDDDVKSIIAYLKTL